MNNALLYLGGLLVVVLAALFAVPAFIDWNGYRGVFEEEASKVLGRDVRVGGAVNVRLLPTPYVRFDKVRLADLTGQTGEPFVRVESFTMRLAVTPLLRGLLEANEIELTRPVLTLALDGKGGGNWSNIHVKPGTLPFVPQNVALHSVKLIDGVIALYNPGAQPVARVEAINGELSAEALNGPFKFKGRATWSGESHDIKFATTEAADGSVRIKATSRSGNSANTFALDGKIEDFSGKPRLNAELTAKLSVPGPDAKAADAKAAEALVMDFKSTLVADATGAKFDDIAMSLDNAVEPQLISGAAKAAWADGQHFDLALNSKWLDLDRLAGAGQESAAFAKIKMLGVGMMKAVAGDGAAAARIDVDQIKIGGETAGGLRIDAERRGGAVLLKTVRAGLPGGARLDLAGEVKDNAGKMSFAGTGFVHGTGLARLLAWAEKSGADIDVKADGAFEAGGRLAMSETNFELTEATAEISGRPFSGEVKMSDDGRRRIAVTLEGASLDSAELFPETARALEAEVRNAFGLSAVGDPATPKTVPATAAGGSDIALRLLARELKHGTETFHDVDASFGFEGGDVHVPSVRFTTSGGLGVALEGRIKVTSGAPTGHLAYELTGATPGALKDAGRVFGLDGVVSQDRLAGLGSGRAAGLIRLGERGKGTADVSLDGTLSAARVTGHAEFDNGLRAWRTAPSTLHVSAKSPDLGTILTGLGAPERLRSSTVSRPAELVLATSGAIATGATTLFEVSAEGFDAAFDGTALWPEAGALAANGTVNLKARDVREAMALAGADSTGGLAGVSAEGRLDLANTNGAWTLSSRRLALGASAISGTATLSRDAQGAPSVNAVIAADRVPLTALLAAVIDRPPSIAVPTSATAPAEAPAGPDVAAAPLRSVWPESAFNLDTLGGLSGDVRVTFAVLQLGDRLAARDGAMVVHLAPGKVSVSDISGQAAGGKLAARCELEKAPGGVAMAAQLKLDGMELGTLSALGKGRAGLELSATSRAQSPAGLVAVLSGGGQLTFDDASLPGPGPRTAADVTDAVLQNEIPNEAGPIAAALEASLTEAAVDAGTRTVKVVLSDGVAKIEPVSLETADGKLSVSAAADLTTLALDSSWLVAPVVAPLPPPPGAVPGWVAAPSKGPLPPAAVVYSGRLDNLGGVKARVDAAELQRELTVRQMERNVEELERLRRQDEERARLEVERRKALEAERAAAKLQKPGAVLPPVLLESARPGASPTAANGQTAPAQQQPTSSATGPAPAAGPDAGPDAGDVQPPRAAVAPRPVPRPRRTTQDEFTRPLGGFPN